MVCVAAGLGVIAQQALHSFEAAASRARQALLQVALSGVAADVAEAVRCGQRFAHLQGGRLHTTVLVIKLSVACLTQGCSAGQRVRLFLLPLMLSGASARSAGCIRMHTAMTLSAIRPALCVCIHHQAAAKCYIDMVPCRGGCSCTAAAWLQKASCRS